MTWAAAIAGPISSIVPELQSLPSPGHPPAHFIPLALDE